MGTCWPGPDEQARRFVAAVTGVVIGKLQLEQITIEAAADAAGFYPALAARQARQGRESRRGRWRCRGLQGGGDAARGAAPPRR